MGLIFECFTLCIGDVFNQRILATIIREVVQYAAIEHKHVIELMLVMGISARRIFWKGHIYFLTQPFIDFLFYILVRPV